MQGMDRALAELFGSPGEGVEESGVAEHGVSWLDTLIRYP